MTAHGASDRQPRRKNGEEGSQEGRGEEAGSSQEDGYEEGREEAVVGLAALALRRHAATGAALRVASSVGHAAAARLDRRPPAISGRNERLFSLPLTGRERGRQRCERT